VGQSQSGYVYYGNEGELDVMKDNRILVIILKIARHGSVFPQYLEGGTKW
jgi:hypothetical protein